jgi:hypothetical protein
MKQIPAEMCVQNICAGILLTAEQKGDTPPAAWSTGFVDWPLFVSATYIYNATEIGAVISQSDISL